MLDSDMWVPCCTLAHREMAGLFAIKRVRQLRIRVQLHNDISASRISARGLVMDVVVLVI